MGNINDFFNSSRVTGIKKIALGYCDKSFTIKMEAAQQDGRRKLYSLAYGQSVANAISNIDNGENVRGGRGITEIDKGLKKGKVFGMKLEEGSYKFIYGTKNRPGEAKSGSIAAGSTDALHALKAAVDLVNNLLAADTTKPVK